MELGLLSFVALGAAVVLGSVTQRVTGLGFSLVASPFIVLVLGPYTGVVLINSVGVVMCGLLAFAQRRAVQFRYAVMLAVPGVVFVLPGAWLARNAPTAVLQVAVGASIVLALLALIAMDRRGGLEPDRDVPHNRASAIPAGALSGFMNAVAGVGGPAVTVYAVATRWRQRSFAATAQLVFMTVSVASLVAKGPPKLPVSAWLVVAAALGLGLLAGVPAMERGVIDAFEFNNPTADRDFGAQDIAKNYMMGSYHQAAEFFEINFNKDKYESLPEDLQAILEHAAEAANTANFGLAMDRYSADLQKLANEDGVNVHRTPDSIMEAQLASWDKVLEGLNQDPFFKKVVDSQKAWSERVAYYWLMNQANYKLAYEHYFPGRLGF